MVQPVSRLGATEDTPAPDGAEQGAHSLLEGTSPPPRLWTGALTPGVQCGKAALSPMKGFAHVAPGPTSGPQETLPSLSPSHVCVAASLGEWVSLHSPSKAPPGT